ncbi:MAG: acetylxylan esterase [Planctomycetota bacterium]|jgi:dienelactone hydrolase|nr:acetylxylan esterase [Planctomycetota bacterium]
MTRTDPLPSWREQLTATVSDRPAEGFSAEGVRGLFLSGPQWRGADTEIFAWYGCPDGPGPHPAMVLVHGGGGTAFDDWVRLWTSRGFAAIAMDTCGCTAGGEHSQRPRHEHGGPPGWCGATQIDWPITDQWPWHATAAVIRAHNWLRQQSEVDEKRIGITGVSWGGVITCWTSSVDHRLACAAPVYGCGYQSMSPKFPSEAAQLGVHDRWCGQWDPQFVLNQVTCPTLWVNGDEDFAFPLDAWAASGEQITQATVQRSIHHAMAHGQSQGAEPEELHAFARHHLCGGPALPMLSAPHQQDGRLHAMVTTDVTIASAECILSADTGLWNEREWRLTEANYGAHTGMVSAAMAETDRAGMLTVITADGLRLSTRPWDRDTPEGP